MTHASVARAYAARGWPVLPLWWPVKGPGRCACRDPGCSSPAKHPIGYLVPHGKDEASTDAAVIARWWAACPRANIGLRAGAVSGLVVLDVDGAAGQASLRALVERHGRFPAAWVRTGSGGWHAYLAHPGITVRNSVGRLGDGLDVRGDGGSIVAPPSLHVAGGRYRWLTSPEELPPAPAWLVDLLTPPPPPARPVRLEVGLAPYVVAAVEREAREVAAAPHGQRNDRLFRAALRLGSLAGAGALSEASVTGVLLAAAETAGLGEREARGTIRSGLGAGMRHPRDIARR
jgi:Bifunctional DNA primase/polymerase, N-terminal